MKMSSKSGFVLSAARGRANRTVMSAVTRLLAKVGAVAIVVLFTTFTPERAAAAPAAYSITNGSATPSLVAPGDTVAIKADFSLAKAGTVAIYFEIHDSSNAIKKSQPYPNQVFSARQVRSYTWDLKLPTSEWSSAGTYNVVAKILAADGTPWVSGIGSFAVTTTSPNPTPVPTPPSSTAGQEFYVDNEKGNDLYEGTSWTAAWKSLGKVNVKAGTFQSGATIHFRCGGVWTGNLQVSSLGAEGAPITYRADAPDGTCPIRPQIKNPGVNYGNAIYVTGSYNIIQGFLVTDAHEAGVKIEANAHDNYVSNNEITRTGTGVMVKGQYNHMTGNYVHHLNMIVNDSQHWTDYGAVCFWLEAGNNEVSYNRGISCKAESIDFGYDGGFVEVWQNGDNSYIHHNYAQNTNGFFELGAGGTGSALDIRVTYNVIVDVTGPGSGTSVCFNTGSYNITVGTFRFENNTFVSTHGNPDAYRVFGCRSDLSALQLRNNIFYSDIQIANNGTLKHSNNLYNMVNMKSGSGMGYTLGSGELSADPHFVNLGVGDFNLKSDSLAIDAGMDLGYTMMDFENVLVPQTISSKLPDIGAYEFPR
jgi:hypothetical protein